MSLGNACGLISTSVVAPSLASANADTWAKPRASVVLPVPGGPASTIRPCGRPASCESLRPCFSVSRAWASRRSLTPLGTTIASQSLSWWSAGRTCSESTPGGSAAGCAISRRTKKRDRPRFAPSSTFGPAIVGPVDLLDLLHAEQRVLRLLEQHQRVGERAHGLEDR